MKKQKSKADSFAFLEKTKKEDAWLLLRHLLFCSFFASIVYNYLLIRLILRALLLYSDHFKASFIVLDKLENSGKSLNCHLDGSVSDSLRASNGAEALERIGEVCAPGCIEVYACFDYIVASVRAESVL